MKIVRDDHVIAAIAGAHITARIGRQDVKARAGAVRAGGEVCRRGDHLGQQLDSINVQRGVFGRRRSGHSSAQPQEQRSPGSGMQQQGQPGLPAVHAQR